MGRQELWREGVKEIKEGGNKQKREIHTGFTIAVLPIALSKPVAVQRDISQADSVLS